MERKSIFSAENISVEANGLASKEVWVIITATNPVDGKSYTKCAGWLSITNTLHSGQKCPAYISQQAGELLYAHKAAIFQALEDLNKELGDTGNEWKMAERRKHMDRPEIEEGQHSERKVHASNRDYWINHTRTVKI